MKTIDTTGLSCPEPVILTMKSVEKGEKQLEIICDSNVSKENVTRYLKEKSYGVEVEENKEIFTIKATR